MTLLFFDGFQDANLVPKPEWATGNWTTPGTGRAGETNGGGTPTNGATIICTLPSNAATCTMGIAFKYTAFDPTKRGISFLDSNGTAQLTWQCNASGFLEARKTLNGTLLGTSSGHTPIATSTWNYVEMKGVLNSSTSGSVELRLNGVVVLTLSGIATSTLTSNVYKIQITEAFPSGTPSYDDMYVIDAVDATSTQGQANNAYLGDIRVQSLFPTAAGDTTGWTPSTGSNWAAVDETPPNTTDYVSLAGTSSGTKDLYNITDLTGTVNTVYGVRVGMYCEKTDSGPATIKTVIKENSTTTDDSAGQGLSLSYGSVWGTAYYKKPSNGAVFSSTDINNLQIGPEVG